MGEATMHDRALAAALQDIAGALDVKPKGETGIVRATGEGWCEIRIEYLASILGVAAKKSEEQDADTQVPWPGEEVHVERAVDGTVLHRFGDIG